MSRNNSQSGHTPSEPLITFKENECNIDQLLNIDTLTTSQSSLVQLNPINMVSDIPNFVHGPRRQHIR